MKRTILSSAIALALGATAVFAAVTFDPATGAGFVGKGDVQLVFGWNNKALQDNAAFVDFRLNSVTESSWECSKPHPAHEGQEIVQERNRIATLAGLVTTVARDNSKGKDGPVTGFYLQGFDGGVAAVVDGPALESCPAEPSGFSLVPGSLTTTELGAGLEVTKDGANWYPVQ